MNTIRLLKKKNTSKLDKIIDILFIFTGTKFYLDYLLLTNPSSKFILFRIFAYPLRYCYKLSRNSTNRFELAIMLFIVHSICFIIFLFISNSIITNILVNIYPCLIQLYYGYKTFKFRNR